MRPRTYDFSRIYEWGIMVGAHFLVDKIYYIMLLDLSSLRSISSAFISFKQKQLLKTSVTQALSAWDCYQSSFENNLSTVADEGTVAFKTLNSDFTIG